MSKKVGIITQHRVVNYGSVLQTYALQEKIKDMGYECEVIDYYPERFTPLGMLKRIKNKGEKFQKSFLIRNAARAIIIPSYIIRFRMFFKFLNDYIDMTPKTYKSEKELESENFDYDVYCTGSDQVWNYGWNERIEYPYYLAFAPESARKISYAASFGKSNIDDNEKEEIIELLNTFNQISVREEAGATLIRKMIGRAAEIIIDPTLMLTREEWDKIAQKPKKVNCDKKYVLTYFLGEKSERISSQIEKLRKKGYDIYNFLDRSQPDLFTADPAEFVYLISKASLVLTDSFHACVFSFIYEKPYLVYAREGKENGMLSRIDTLLSKFNMRRKYVDSGLKNELFEHNYLQGKMLLNKEREKSICFLKKALEIV